MQARLTMQAVEAEEIAAFRIVVEAYWRDLMPNAWVMETAERRADYFHSRFSWETGAPPFWAIADGRCVGFAHFTITKKEWAVAEVHDFFVAATERRKGHGTAMVAWLLAHFDEQDVKQVDLNVRADTPDASQFWAAQGFEVASYRLRQYRNWDRP